MSYAAEAIASTAPPPKPAAGKSEPQATSAGEPSFDDHLAAETEAPSPAPMSAPCESADGEEAAPVEAAAPGDDSAAESDAAQTPEMANAPTPPPTPLGAPVLVQLIAQTNLEATPEEAPQIQAPPVDAPTAPPRASASPVNDAAPTPELPVDASAPPPTEAKPQSEAKTNAAPTSDLKPHEKSAAPQAATQAPSNAPETAPAAPAQPDAQPQPAVATRPEAASVTPTPQVVPAAPPTPPPTQTKTQTPTNTETSESDAAAPTPLIAETPAPTEAQAPRPAPTRATPVEADAPQPQAEDDGSVQEKFAAALEKSTPRHEAKPSVERATAASQQPVAADVTPALTNSAAPESMSATAHVNALGAATTHASAQIQALNADHVLRAAPAATQVAQEIVRRFNGDSTKFELRLDPPELGRVEVKLEVTRDHKVTAVVSADSPQALTELARHARDLEQSLQSAGLELTENGLSFDLRQSREDAQDASGEGGRGAHAQNDDDALEQTAPLARPIGLERWRGVRVDVMA